MKIRELSKKNIKELNVDLLNLLRNKFNLNLQISSGHVRCTHLLKKMRRDIARLKTLLTKKDIR